MTFLNLMKNFFNKEISDTDVITVSNSNYVKLQVVLREDCLVLYGPTPEKKYDLLLQTSLEVSANKAFSLFRVEDSLDAQHQFLNLKEIIIPLVTVIPNEIFHVATLQDICNLSKKCPSWTVAHISVHFGFQQMLNHTSVLNYIDKEELVEQKTPIHLAIEANNLKIVDILIQQDVNLKCVDNKGNSVFHYAAISNKDIIQRLAEVDIALINACNSEGKTPLHLACEGDKPDCVKQLLIAGADVNIAANHESSLPIHAAVNANSMMCMKEIIAVHPKQLNIEDMKNGGTPLHWATTREMINALVDLGCRINGKNFHGSTALHNMVQQNNLACVIAALSWSAEVNARNDDGDSPLHLAHSIYIVQALLVFGADTSAVNNKGETPRHKISISSYAEKNLMLYYMHALGAKRCSLNLSTCNEGCSPHGSFGGIPPPAKYNSRERTHIDEYLEEAMNSFPSSLGFGETQKEGRILCLDGGGIRGLVLIQLLMVIEERAQTPILSLFDCISGTSTGGILALALSCGKTPTYCQGLYFRLKDQIFTGMRPYDEKPLEDILKNEFGEDTCMNTITTVKVAVTGVLADRYPADLHFFRNYLSGCDLLNVERGISNHPFPETHSPSKQKIWQAARASGAAPSYFRAFGRFIDGGLIANNPTLDFLTDIAERNTVLKALHRDTETENISVVVSLGTGRVPVTNVSVIDVFNPDSFFKVIRIAAGLSSMAKLLIDQATMADNRTVDRARAWCGMCSMPYFRFSPQLSLDIPLDESKDEILVNMLWETRVFAYSRRNTISRLVNLIRSPSMDVDL